MIVTILSIVIAISSVSQSVSASSSFLNTRATPVQCPICGDATQQILNPNHEFTMPNGITWSCIYLQETVQDVNMHGHDGERTMCGSAQQQALQGGCLCPTNPSTGQSFLDILATSYVDLNGPCNLCSGIGHGRVPTENYAKTTATSNMGTLNCQGLEGAMANGVVSATMCPQLQTDAAPTCCLVGSTGGAGSAGTTYLQSQPLTQVETASFNSGNEVTATVRTETGSAETAASSTVNPTVNPTTTPSVSATVSPTATPTVPAPSSTPSDGPSTSPIVSPSLSPSKRPTLSIVSTSKSHYSSPKTRLRGIAAGDPLLR